MNDITNYSAMQLRQAANLKEQIESLQNELAGYLGGSPIESAPRKKNRMSAAGRARIIAAQKARWAKVHAAAGTAKGVKKTTTTRKRKLSAAARARIAAVARARWAKVKAAGKKSL